MEIGYKREYKLRVLVPGRKYISVGIPYEVIQREAEKRGITIADFLNTFVAVAEYDNFDGIRYTFKEANTEVV